MLRVIAVCVALCALPTIAAAEGSPDPNYCGQGQDCTQYYMDAEDVDGSVVGPDNPLIQSGGRMRQLPLIRTRAHFIDLMLKSVENL